MSSLEELLAYAEARFNPNHDEHGRFAESDSAGGDAAPTEGTTDAGTQAPISPQMRDTFTPEALASIDKAYADITTKYQLDVQRMGIDELGIQGAETHNNEAFHVANGDVTSTRESSIVFDSSLADSAATVDGWNRAIAIGFHPPAGPDNDIYAAITTHELGHVLEFQRGFPEIRDRAEETLRGMWQDHNSTASDDMVFNDFGTWVHEYVSGYAAPYTHDGSFSAKPNYGEALAEAFQDVEMNGSNAKPTSVALHHLLTARRR